MTPIAQAQVVPVAEAQMVPLVQAAEVEAPAATLSEIRENLEFIFPSGAYLSGLKYHSNWEEVSRGVMNGVNGVEVTYRARFDQAPQLDDELPTINAYILPQSSQSAAAAQFESWSNSPNFTNGTWSKVSEGPDHFSYLTDSLYYNDLIKNRTLEEASLHLVSYYDNVIIVVNFYRTAGLYNKNNVTAYLSYLATHEETTSILNELVVFSEEALRFFLGSLFSVEGPVTYDIHPETAGESVELTGSMEVPRNGKISLDLYIDDASETGTILDMSGSDTPFTGGFTLELNENAILEYSFYDERIRSTCQDDEGWHHLANQTPLTPYEWQTMTLTYGWIEGLALFRNGDIEASCAVNTPRADGPIYVGDYPGDATEESFVGYIKDITVEFTESEGTRLDDTEADLIFADVSENHPNATAIQYMKDNEIISGYANGTFRPYQPVNRVEILKMLLLGFDYDVPDNMRKPTFSDIEAGAWYLPYPNLAISRKIINGYPNGTYLPSHSLNRAEFLKILLNAYGVSMNDYPITTLYPDADRDAWYAPYVQYAKDNGLMDLDEEGNFNPGAEVSRAEVAETVYRLINAQ